MRRFAQLYVEMDRTKRTGEKLAALERYFREVPAIDAAWGLHFLAGRRIKRLASRTMLRDLIEQATGLPRWLIGESHEAVGDLAETLALLMPEDDGSPHETLSLHEVVEGRMLPMRSMPETKQRELIHDTWRQLDQQQRFIFNKLITGNFRVGVAQTMITKALAAAAGVPAAEMAHRFSGSWQPSADAFNSLMRPAGEPGSSDPQRTAQPLPFFLGYPLDVDVAALGDPTQWIVEWKYDGIRAQVIHRPQPVGVMIWSRGDELITPAFPEVAQEAAALAKRAVLDGELLAWEQDGPLPFSSLQRRLNRVRVEPTLFPDVPVKFLTFDLLELEGEDLRQRPLQVRRELLMKLLRDSGDLPHIALAPSVSFGSWDELVQARQSARGRGVEGLMLKRVAGAYGVGRRRGDWWKWKIDPLLVDAVLIHAQGGSGRRSGLFTDYTFGVWDRAATASDRELVPVAKAYSGLTDDEIRQVDRFIKANTLAKHGPIRTVKPELVFELAFEGIQESNRHKAGMALRFPRINRWRTDKKPGDADTLQTLQAMLRQAAMRRPPGA